MALAWHARRSQLALLFLVILLSIFVPSSDWAWVGAASPAVHSRGGEDAALRYYTSALRGAAVSASAESSHEFRSLAKIHYRAVMLRKHHNFGGASRVYRQAIQLQQERPPAAEVPACISAACSWLNLALTEQKSNSLVAARRTFQDGVAMVQDLMLRDLHIWVDGQNRLRSSSPEALMCPRVQAALGWLATLLVAWGLLENKRGNSKRAKVLTQKAAVLDGSKSKVLAWKALEGDL
mmetsp:Transcript_30201/g.54826  ORF Transcript_30201/g.54826 Transcript_30201/m.54826 type:complete len:237 (+) Transcript_30201:58-768(+)